MPGRQGRSPIELTPLAVLVLGLATERPMHPYEMFQTLVERREDRFAKLRPGSLYHTVGRLHDRELLLVSDIQREGNRPERTVYAITDDGRAMLRDNIAAMLSTPADEYPALYLALAEAHTLGRGEVVDLLEQRVDAMHDQLEAIDAEVSRAAARGFPEMFMLDAGCRRVALAAQIEWIRQLRGRLATGQLMWLDEWHRRANDEHHDHNQHADEAPTPGSGTPAQNEV
ncbi:PadR family transcriptional regulator [Williamsia sp. 1138]|uniref:PadR family transcriptional regulator n=1 Tax=Williamsia sp. 1138 TaxID=1903117 RepID=UPI000A1148CF|nr:PadR family transcriptional regulator [Williamsia sp. 1138]OZG30300.1 PadR family transcriptional regulator [Williamsia sp. 1138]